MSDLQTSTLAVLFDSPGVCVGGRALHGDGAELADAGGAAFDGGAAALHLEVGGHHRGGVAAAVHVHGVRGRVGRRPGRPAPRQVLHGGAGVRLADAAREDVTAGDRVGAAAEVGGARVGARVQHLARTVHGGHLAAERPTARRQLALRRQLHRLVHLGRLPAPQHVQPLALGRTPAAALEAKLAVHNAISSVKYQSNRLKTSQLLLKNCF